MAPTDHERFALLTSTSPPVIAAGGVCRVAGCTAEPRPPRGFCPTCEHRYGRWLAARTRRIRLLAAVLRAARHPLFDVFCAEQQRVALAAHALAHLELAGRRGIAVPRRAVEDFLAEQRDARHDDA